MSRLHYLPLIAAAWLVGCSGDEGGTNTPVPETDTGVAETSNAIPDTGSSEDSSLADSASDDTGSTPEDTGSAPDDVGADSTLIDSSPVDSGMDVNVMLPDTTGDTAMESAVDTGPAATCTDGLKNGTETDTDCGGTSCPKCVVSKTCVGAEDCTTGICTANKCAEPSCTDGLKNAAETDIDCGGATCPKCALTKTCTANTDCASAFCSGGKCASPSCTDTVKNGAETDVDCGGGTCAKCVIGKDCAAATDCASNFCSGGKCVAPSCTDGSKNGTESDVDCGGSCAGCSSGRDCTTGADCKSLACSAGKCVATCFDTEKNGGESDVDCGGTCTKCVDLKRCNAPSDCVSGVCTAGICQAPTCSDGVQNGTETDVDCGGSCAACGFTALIYSDWNAPASASAAAVTALGGTPLLMTDTGASGATFATAFDAGGFSVVIIDALNYGLPAPVRTRLQTWISGGGRVVFNFWSLNSDPTIASALGVSVVSSFNAPRQVHAVTSGPVNFFSMAGGRTVPSPLTFPSDTTFGDNGDVLALTGSGFIAATFDSTSGGGAIAVTHGNRVVVNGFMPYDAYTTDNNSNSIADSREIWENEIRWVRLH